MLRHRILAITTVSFTACATPSQPGGPASVTPVIQVQAGKEFEIAAGQEARILSTPITLRFIAVSQDSRCPSDVQCVWAGNAVVGLSLSSTGGSPASVSLNSTLDPKSTVYSGYRIRLVGLKPVPRSGSSIPSGDYVATLEVLPA